MWILWWYKFKDFTEPSILSDSLHTQHRTHTHTIIHKVTFTGTHKHLPLLLATLYTCDPQENCYCTVDDKVYNYKILLNIHYSMVNGKDHVVWTYTALDLNPYSSHWGILALVTHYRKGLVSQLWLLNQTIHLKHLVHGSETL